MNELTRYYRAVTFNVVLMSKKISSVLYFEMHFDRFASIWYLHLIP